MGYVLTLLCSLSFKQRVKTVVAFERNKEHKQREIIRMVLAIDYVLRATEPGSVRLRLAAKPKHYSLVSNSAKTKK